MILIVDDDNAIRASLSFLLGRAGYEVRAVATPKEAIAEVRAAAPELVLMDMNFSLSTSGEEGLVLLRQVKVFCPETPVILITAWGSISLAVQGMRAGASDFVTKPWNNHALLNSVRTALELHGSRTEAGNACGSTCSFPKIIGRSAALKEALHTVERIAQTNASVLITGESGTGKELVAEAIHANSQRSKGPFVKVNLGGISQTLFESEMFGHKKGAFTNAVADRAGRFELADRGTIFLDEIGELDLGSQVKLLRVLQEQTFERLGESRPRKVDVRIVSATNRDLRRMVDEHAFREDLFYRINLITVHLPALRERRDDIPLLARHFADKLTEENRLPAVSFSDEAMEFLQRLPYPGNVRELKNLVERTILICGKERLEKADFEQQCRYEDGTADVRPGMTLEEVERRTIVQALQKYNNNLSQVAAALGISRQSLYRRIEKYHLTL